MTRLKHYVSRLRTTIGHWNKPGGIPWHPGPSLHDLYPEPQMAFCWYQPEDLLTEEVPIQKNGLRGWFSR